MSGNGQKVLLTLGSVLGIGLIGMFLSRGDRSHQSMDAASNGVPPVAVDVSGVDPGLSQVVTLGDLEIRLSVPEGDGYTGGDLRVESPTSAFATIQVERSGSLERWWQEDLDQDGTMDGLLVIRSGGSGSYVDLLLFRWLAGQLEIQALPEMNFKGYGGHDHVEVLNRRIWRRFPTYVYQSHPRLDGQYDKEDLAAGRSPVRIRSDSQMSPSGRDVEQVFDFQSWTWVSGP